MFFVKKYFVYFFRWELLAIPFNTRLFRHGRPVIFTWHQGESVVSHALFPNDRNTNEYLLAEPLLVRFSGVRDTWKVSTEMLGDRWLFW